MAKLRSILAALWTFLVFGVVGTLGIATLGLCPRLMTRWWPGFWGRSALWIGGVRLVVIGKEHLNAKGSKIIVANHTSALDIPAGAALGPDWPLCMAKAELWWFPFFNLMWWSLGQVFVDRSDSVRASEAITRIAVATKKHARTVIIAPEGTRGPEGAIGKFKLGAFRIAAATGAPIVPVVMRGNGRLMPRGQWWANPGEIVIEIMPPISTAGWTPESVKAHATELEARYREWVVLT